MAKRETNAIALQLIKQTTWALKVLNGTNDIPEAWRNAITKSIGAKKRGRPVKNATRDIELTIKYLQHESRQIMIADFLQSKSFENDKDIQVNLRKQKLSKKAIENKVLDELNVRLKDRKAVLDIVRKNKPAAILESARRIKADLQKGIVAGAPKTYRFPKADLQRAIAEIDARYPRLNVNTVKTWVETGKKLGD